MSYNVVIAADFGATNTGLTVHGKLFGTNGAQVGSTITTGFVEAVAGLYVYVLAAPDSQEGVFVAYNSANAALRRVAVIAPRETENADVKASTLSTLTAGDIPGTSAIVTAIFAVAVETGHDLTTVLRAIYAAVRGKSITDDPDMPTYFEYLAPDNTTVRLRHDISEDGTVRSVTVG